MTKVRFIYSSDLERLENNVNNFISDKSVWDIQLAELKDNKIVAVIRYEEEENKVVEDVEKELTYGDIYNDFRRRHPIFCKYVLDYRPAIELFQTIVIWTKEATYHYSYPDKKLSRVESI